jgi:hypothetical protein
MTQSRQVAYQNRQNAKGLCKLCPSQLSQSGLCAEHYIRHLELNRLRTQRISAQKRNDRGQQ